MRSCRSVAAHPARRVCMVWTGADPRLARINRPGHFRRFFFIFKRARKIRAGGFCERGSELIAEHACAYLLDRAFSDFTELKRAEGKPDQAVDSQPEMFEHAFDLAVLAFAQRHRQPAIRALQAIEGCLDAGIMHTIERQILAQTIEERLTGCAFRADSVAPDPAGRRQLKDAR